MIERDKYIFCIEWGKRFYFVIYLINMLFIIPTPIGNREDITLRALRLFKELSVFFCEDTRTARSLFAMYNIPTQDKKFCSLTSFTASNLLTYYQELISRWDCGLISEAGTPWLSDPGKELVKICVDHHYAFEVLPGATALIPAVVASWFDTKQFIFYGFMPTKKGRNKMLQKMMTSQFPSFFYESVHRIVKLSQELQDLHYDGLISISREISKLHHQHRNGNLIQWQSILTDQTMMLKWERVIGLQPISPQIDDQKYIL